MNCYNESHSPTVRKENCFGFDLWVHIFHRYLHVVGLKSYSTNVNYTLFFKHVNNFIFFIHHLIHPESICMALSDIILMRRLIHPESICIALSDIILMRRLIVSYLPASALSKSLKPYLAEFMIEHIRNDSKQKKCSRIHQISVLLRYYHCTWRHY